MLFPELDTMILTLDNLNSYPWIFIRSPYHNTNRGPDEWSISPSLCPLMVKQEHFSCTTELFRFFFLGGGGDMLPWLNDIVNLWPQMAMLVLAIICKKDQVLQGRSWLHIFMTSIQLAIHMYCCHWVLSKMSPSHHLMYSARHTASHVPYF